MQHVSSSGEGRPSAPGAPPQRTYYAHTANDAEGKPLPESSGKWQPLAEHLRNVAKLASEFAAPFGAGDEAYLAGLLHDLGKYADRFQQRLRDPRVRGINHWAAGAAEAYAVDPLCGFAADGHHTGLPSADDLRQTLLRMGVSADRAQLTGCGESADDLRQRAVADGIQPTLAATPSSDPFAAAHRCRMIFSTLLDADFLDTEAHFDPAAAARRQAPSLDASAALRILSRHLDRMPAGGPMNEIRRALLGDCLAAAVRPPGLFTLTAPAGGGKTLASLAFALRHIESRNSALAPADAARMRRVIVVIPYTSVIEQTAAVLRELFLPFFGPDYVLEHHSAADHAGKDADPAGCQEQRARLAAENWAAPVVVTTSVQFFESLLGNQPAKCRKLHNIARSVILFDEVQTLPPRLLPSLLSSVSLLAQEPFGCTAVFMTATQPAFDAVRTGLGRVWAPRAIPTDSPARAAALHRTRIELPPPGEALGWAEVARRMTSHRQALCVVNTTRHARELYRLLPSGRSFHLSARMCPAHRQAVLANIKTRLLDGDHCLLASTQVVEAGVDLDFPAAFRALGPLDSIIQTAGRCNREGRLPGPAPVSVFRPDDHATPPGAYRSAAALTVSFLAQHPDAAARIEDPSLYAAYFAELYAAVGRAAPEHDPAYAASHRFDFPAAARACRLVPEDSVPVLVPWGDGRELIERAQREKCLSLPDRRRSQRFSVGLLRGELAEAEALGYAAEAAEGLWYWTSDYDDALGACHAEGDAFIN